MKRFKDCSICCVSGQSVNELANLIIGKCLEKSYRVDESSSFQQNDTFSVFFNKQECPISRLILLNSSEENSVKIINIVPDCKSYVSLDKDQYNQILDFFKADIFFSIKEEFGNEIKETSANYTIEEIIPHSFKLLNRWLNAYPLSGHTLDQKRWFDFLISLVKNDESLSLDDFSQYIKENYNWSEKDISRFEFKLEEELSLLRYYNERR